VREAILLDLGILDYQAAWGLQRRLVELRAGSAIPDVFLILEHPHVYTMGRKGDPATIPRVGVPIYHVERGGYATYHGPGQIVGYPIIHLRERGMDIKQYIHTLEEALMDLTRSFGLTPSRVDGHPGVWVRGRKVASIGVAVHRWITYHGFAYNVNTDLTFFQRISPCGLDPTMITSLERELGRPVDFGEAKRAAVEALENHFDNRFSREVPPAIAHILPTHIPPSAANL
jgi:lipoate-protein ligase B